MQMILLFLLLFAGGSPRPKTPLKISVLYFSTVEDDMRKELLKNISATYNCTVTEIKGIAALPAAAYYKPRNRYRAPALLDHLNTITGSDKQIGITNKDISTTSRGVYDWGIMGLANCPGRSCVISTFRMRTTDKKLFEDRFIKVALHELGHTMGLPHCTFSKTCFMGSAEGTVKSVDRETRFLCANCKKSISQYIP